MPRPALSDQELEATQMKILAEARRIIAADGYEALSMRRLADGIGMTAGALYRYFPTKQHVLNGFWSAAIADLNRCFADLDAEPLPATEVIGRMLTAYADFALADRDRFRVMFLENDFGAMDAFGQQPETYAGYRLLLARVERAIAEGALQPMSADTATHILWGAVHGVLTLVITVKELDFGDARELVSKTIACALRGLSTS